MVQKEVRKKTKVYGTVAVLSALVLVTMIYAVGTTPLIYPPNQGPFVSGMKTFSSIDELKTYINNATNGYNSYRGGPLDSKFFGQPAPIPMPAAAQSAGLGFGSTNTYYAESYSTTNIQVTGVDEADLVKTDGQYIYTVTNNQVTGYYYSSNSSPESSNSIYIIKADSQDPQVVSKIALGNDTEPAGLFLS